MTNDLGNEDWLRTMSWDVRLGTEPVSTLDDLLTYLKVAGKPKSEQMRAVYLFTKLPAWKPAPRSLKSEVDTYLAEA